MCIDNVQNLIANMYIISVYIASVKIITRCRRRSHDRPCHCSYTVSIYVRIKYIRTAISWGKNDVYDDDDEAQ